MQMQEGSILEGKVMNLTKFGAFIRFDDGNVGLVHISEIADEYVKDVNDYLKVNQVVKVKVLSLEDGKINLSIKQASQKKKKSSRPEEINWDKNNQSNMSFEDKLSKFMQDSNERMKDIKKQTESKRGSSYKKSSGSF